MLNTIILAMKVGNFEYIRSSNNLAIPLYTDRPTDLLSREAPEEKGK